MTMLTIEQLEAVEQKARVEDAVVRSAMARIRPSWTMVERAPGGGIFRCGVLQVFFSVLRYEDHRTWLHVSLCGRTGQDRFHLPSWEDVKRVKTDFIGEDRWAYQVFPDARAYINQNPYVLHLFSLLDGTPALPDFTWGLGTL